MPGWSRAGRSLRASVARSPRGSAVLLRPRRLSGAGFLPGETLGGGGKVLGLRSVLGSFSSPHDTDVTIHTCTFCSCQRTGPEKYDNRLAAGACKRGVPMDTRPTRASVSSLIRGVNPLPGDALRHRMPEASLERLRKFLLPLELAEAELKAKPAAAVVVLLQNGARDLEVLLGERSKREGDPWSGQIGLPGGRRRAEDGTVLATAVRETREEVGIDLEGQADILGHMAPRAPGNKPEVLVVPYVAVARSPIEATPGPEMASVFWTPLRDLPPTHARRVVPTILGELNVPSFTYDDRLIWGFTYRILEELLVLVGLSA